MNAYLSYLLCLLASQIYFYFYTSSISYSAHFYHISSKSFLTRPFFFNLSLWMNFNPLYICLSQKYSYDMVTDIRLSFSGKLHVSFYSGGDTSAWQRHVEASVSDTRETVDAICWNTSPRINNSASYLTLSGTPGMQYFAEIYINNISLKLGQEEKFTVQDTERYISIFDSPANTTKYQLDITVTSPDNQVAYLKVSEFCTEVCQIGIYNTLRPSVMLTFSKQARLTLTSDRGSSLKAKAKTRYFIGVFLKKKSMNLKNVTLVVNQSFNYEYLKPICFLVFLSFFVGVIVTIWALVCFRVPPTLDEDFSPDNGSSRTISTLSNPDANNSTLQTLRNLFFPCICSCDGLPENGSDEMRPLIPRRQCSTDYSTISCFELFQAMWKVVKLHWLGQGVHSFSNVTGIVGFVLMVGAFQFVYENWSVMILSGNRDQCYYNEFCYRVSSADIPFNLMISNLAYMIHGLLLGWSVWIREAEFFAQARKFAKLTVLKCGGAHGLYRTDNPNSEKVPKHFLQCQNIHQHLPELKVPIFEASDEDVCELFALAYKRKFSFSIGYAFAWALIFEGFFSLIYHFCPTRLIFQFDSAFMFVISGLIVMSLYNGVGKSSRCCLVKAITASNFFLVVVVPLFVFNYLGSLYNLNNLSKFVKIMFFIALGLWYMYLFGWAFIKLFAIQIALRDCRTLINCSGATKILCFILTLVFTVTVFSLLYNKDMSHVFLFSCIFSALVSIFAKIIINTNEKLAFDKCSLKQVILKFFQVSYVLTTVAVMFTAVWVFQGYPTSDKSLKPPGSRNLNKDCVLLNFFDYHDIWHILSSFGLLMGAYLVMYISD